MFALAELEELANHPLLPGLLLALLVSLTLIFSWSPWKQLISHWRLHALVDKLGKASMRNVFIPDGLGDDIYVEQLLLQDNGLLLVTVKSYRGNIFAAEQIEFWTQVLGHHSYKFKNPLHQQQTDLQALQALVPKVALDGLVVFSRGCRFPKGKPDKVVDYEMLKNIKTPADQITPFVEEAWQTLLKVAVPARSMRQSILYRRGDKRRLILGMVFGVMTVVYVLWYLGLLS
jgi:hypothetical protein